ncbi:MAG: hypothetical protein IJ574_02340 [Bacilli bacterium]|nr:hypothetical protein [Bacilli bacterium]
MKSYLLKKVDSEYENVVINNDNKCYTFTPRIRNLDVKKVSVFDSYLIDNILTNKFNRSLHSILNKTLIILNDEDETSGGTGIVLDEIARLKSIVGTKYNEFLSKEKEDKFYNQLETIEVEIQREVMERNMNNMINRMNYFETQENEKGYSR